MTRLRIAIAATDPKSLLLTYIRAAFPSLRRTRAWVVMDSNKDPVDSKIHRADGIIAYCSSGRKTANSA